MSNYIAELRTLLYEVELERARIRLAKRAMLKSMACVMDSRVRDYTRLHAEVSSEHDSL